MISYNFILKTFPYIFFIYLLSAINNPPFLYESGSIIYKIKFLLGISPILIVFLSIIYLFQNKSKIRLDKLMIFYMLFLTYCFLQFIPIIFDEGYRKPDVIFNIARSSSIYWVIATISLPLFLYSINILDKKLKTSIYHLFVVIFCFVTIFYLTNLFIGHFSHNTVSFSFYGNPNLDPDYMILESHVPRSSGMARYVVLLFILLHLIQDNYTFKSQSLKFIIKFFLIFLLFVTLHLQSRTIIFFIIIYGIFYLLPFHRLKIYTRLKDLLIISSMAILLHISFPLIGAKIKFSYLNLEYVPLNVHQDLRHIVLLTNKNILEEPEKNLLSINKNNDEEIIEEDEKIIEIIGDYSTFIAKGRFDRNLNSSGRFSHWKKSLILIKSNLFFGLGPQADKRFLKENLSNLYLYSLICGGIFAFLCLIISILIVVEKCIRETFIKNEFKLKGNILKKFSLYCIGFLIFRSIAENSFGIFGVDYFIYFLAANKLILD